MSESDGAVGEFRRSSFSAKGGNCVEVCLVQGAGVVVRHSRLQGPQLAFTRDEWLAFLAGAKAGEFDPA